MAEENKPDVVLSDGREVRFDMYQVKRGEYARIANGEADDAEAFAVLERACGIPAKDYDDLPQPDFAQLIRAFHRRAISPLAERSASESTSESSTD